MNERVHKPETVALPPIPAKRYFTIGEVSELCGVKPHVLRYWEQEFTQLKPVKRRGNRRYYHQGFTISGARNKLNEREGRTAPVEVLPEESFMAPPSVDVEAIRSELNDILQLLTLPKKE